VTSFRPRSRSETAPRIVVRIERTAGSGRFEVDPRLQARRAESGALPRPGRAIIEVRLDDDFIAADAMERYHPDRRVLICAEPAAPESPRVLFDGYPTRQEHRIAATGAARERLVLHAVSLIERLARRTESQLFGRVVRRPGTKGEWPGDGRAIAPIGRLTAQPCIFDSVGCPNRDPDPVVVRLADGRVRRVHLFTWDGSPRARPWTALQAIRYILFAHGRCDGLIEFDSLLAETDAFVGESPEGRHAWRESDPLRFDLLTPLGSFDVDGLNVAEALSRVTASAGLLLWSETESRADGAVSRWRLGGLRDRGAADLALAEGGRGPDGAPRYDARGRSAAAVLADNQVAALRHVRDDGRNVAPRGWAAPPPIVTLTVPLLPGWLPAGGLDSVAPGERAAAKAAALTAAQVRALAGDPSAHAWFRSYHARGGEFRANRDVGRRWVLNEDGALDPARYNRNAPFDAYERFDPAGLIVDPMLREQFWSARQRRLLPIPGEPWGLTPGDVRVELSFDGGAIWSVLPRGYRVLAERAGIWIDADNPLDVAPPNGDPDTINLWHALIDQTLRVRVTAGFESDERPVILASDGLHPARTLHADGPILPAKAAVGAPRGGDLLAEPIAPGPLDEHAAAARRLSDRIDRCAGAAVCVTPFIPWIETELPLGRRIAMLRGRDQSFAAQRAPFTRAAALLGRTWWFGPDRFGTQWRLGIDSFDAESKLAEADSDEPATEGSPAGDRAERGE